MYENWTHDYDWVPWHLSEGMGCPLQTPLAFHGSIRSVFGSAVPFWFYLFYISREATGPLRTEEETEAQIGQRIMTIHSSSIAKGSKIRTRLLIPPYVPVVDGGVGSKISHTGGVL